MTIDEIPFTYGAVQYYLKLTKDYSFAERNEVVSAIEKEYAEVGGPTHYYITTGDIERIFDARKKSIKS